MVLHLNGEKAPSTIEADAVLVAVGRKANSDGLALENTSIKTNKRGWIEVDKKLRTNVSHVFAIGDVVGDPMLAHKSSHQGKVAAEVASGHASAFTPMGIPSVAYTSPEVAWIGLTEAEAKEKGIAFKKGAFPWTANGRALSAVAPRESPRPSMMRRQDAVGQDLRRNAGELISEAVLAWRWGCCPGYRSGIHPHPTLSETFALLQSCEGRHRS